MEIELEKSIDAQVCGYVGRGVRSVQVDGQGHLIFTMTDGEILDLGPVIGSGSGGGETATVELDTTLSRSGMAAEAKATGDAIVQVETASTQAAQQAQEALTLATTATEQADGAVATANSALDMAQSAQEVAQSATQEAQNATWIANQTRNTTGDLSKLETDHKDDLVVAINELHQELGESDGSGATTQPEAWIWSSQVEPDAISLEAFPATAEGIRLRVYCLGGNGETVVFPIQPPENMGFEGGMIYSFTHQGQEVIFEDTGDILVLSSSEELVIYGFYYTSTDTASGGGSVERWRDQELAYGAILSGENLSGGMDTGLTLGDLRTYRKWLFRLKNQGKATMTDFYIMTGYVTDPAKGTVLLRFSSGGASIFYEWWDKDRTKLAVRSVYAGDPSKVAEPGEPVAVAESDHWLYHNTLTPGAIDRLTDLEDYDDDTPVWFYCASAPTMDYTWDIRGVTQ